MPLACVQRYDQPLAGGTIRSLTALLSRFSAILYITYQKGDRAQTVQLHQHHEGHDQVICEYRYGAHIS